MFGHAAVVDLVVARWLWIFLTYLGFSLIFKTATATLTSPITSSISLPSQSPITSATSGFPSVAITALSPRGITNFSISDPSITGPAWSCYEKLAQRAKSLQSAYDANNTYTTVKTVKVPNDEVETTTIYPTSVSVYTLCDGTPRVDAQPETKTKTISSTIVYTETVSQVRGLETPPCSLTPAQCRFLLCGSDLGLDNAVLQAACGSPAHACQPCLIQGGPVQLLYFPETSSSKSACNQTVEESQVITSGLPINSVVTMGTTLTSGSVYLFFSTIFAYWDGFGDRVGANFSDLILPFASSEISTQCGGWTASHGLGTALNYADLNYPVPASAYSCAGRCATDYARPKQCSTIWSDFNPILAMPTRISSLDPSWSTCSYWDEALPNFVFDPPVILRSETSFRTPAFTTTEAQSTSAMATPSPTAALVEKTTTSDPLATPSPFTAEISSAMPSVVSPSSTSAAATPKRPQKSDSERLVLSLRSMLISILSLVFL